MSPDEKASQKLSIYRLNDKAEKTAKVLKERVKHELFTLNEVRNSCPKGAVPYSYEEAKEIIEFITHYGLVASVRGRKTNRTFFRVILSDGERLNELSKLRKHSPQHVDAIEVVEQILKERLNGNRKD